MFALFDASNFYASVEQSFRPSLQGRPLVVLSNNDGCAIARSQEAKALGIKMGAPWFKISHLSESHGLLGLSANFTLYGDMSSRLMSLIAGFGYRTELYSIDEAFCSCDGIRGDLTERAFKVRARIRQWIGLQCGVGIGPTKTLAKLANHVSKDAERKPGSYPAHLAQVCNLATLSADELKAIMQATAVGDVWGVGRKIGAQLVEAGVLTAWDLSRMDPGTVRRRWNVVLERTVRELCGQSCMALEDVPTDKKQIAVTRSFGRPVTTLEPLLEAVSEFASRAAEKLRKQGSCKRQLSTLLTRSLWDSQTSRMCRSKPKPTRHCVPSPGSMVAVRLLMRTMVPTTVCRYLSSKATFSPQRKSLRVGRGAAGGSGATA